MQCPPINKCTDATDSLTDPPCCCKKCKAPYVPMCTADSSGNLNKGCNEPGGSGCGCKCPASEQIQGGREAPLLNSSSQHLCARHCTLLLS